jgi:ribosomal protein L11 methyltransferase
MFLWRKFAELRWVKTHEDALQARAPGQLVIVRKSGRKLLELEIVCRSRSDSTALIKEFGGRIEALPRNWLERFAHGDSKPIKIGKRLMIVRSLNEQHCSVRLLRRSPGEGGCPQRSSHRRAGPEALRTAPFRAGHLGAGLAIPVSLAFGAGEHATTAMSLRFLEQLTRRWHSGWSLVDLGTGSGILALAAKCFCAGRVIGIDNDPAAISVAKSNARLNRIRGAGFQLGDVHNWNSAQEIDVITANLYSDLLIEILPKLGCSRWLIISGILRSQQNELVRALQRNHCDIVSVKRCGKWVAILAVRIRTARPAEANPANFCGGHTPPLQ